MPDTSRAAMERITESGYPPAVFEYAQAKIAFEMDTTSKEAKKRLKKAEDGLFQLTEMRLKVSTPFDRFKQVEFTFRAGRRSRQRQKLVLMCLRLNGVE